MPGRYDEAVIAQRIARARAARGLTKQGLAAKAGIELWSYTKKEKGKLSFHVEELARVCEALDAPSTFPFLEWDRAALADRVLELVDGEVRRAAGVPAAEGEARPTKK
jgi:transcriptional regulator with XRE-family HTH domain